MEYPDFVITGLTKLFKELPVQEDSADSRAIQAAISLLNFPDSFKKGVHVFLNSRYQAREEGCYDIREISIKIYTNKIAMRRRHSEYNSLCDIDINKTYRYIFPNEKYNANDFQNVVSDLGDLFCEDYSMDESDPSGIMINSSNFKIESNIIKKNNHGKE